MGGHTDKTVIYEPGSRSSPDAGSVDASVLDFQPPELQEVKFPLFISCPVYDIYIL